jgi:hypothetical protein
MDRIGRLRRLVLGPLFVMLCGVVAIAIVVLGVLWISDRRDVGLYPLVAQGLSEPAPIRR